MITVGALAVKMARHRGWDCCKLRAFFEHCAQTGYRLDVEHHVSGSSLGPVMLGFETFVFRQEGTSTIESPIAYPRPAGI